MLRNALHGKSVCEGGKKSSVVKSQKPHQILDISCHMTLVTDLLDFFFFN